MRHRLQVHGRMPAPGAQGVEQDILGNAIKPGGEFGLRLVAFAMAINAEKDILGKVLRLFTPTELAEELTEDHGPVALDQLREGAGIVPLHLQHEADFRIGHPGLGRKPAGFTRGSRCSQRHGDSYFRRSQSHLLVSVCESAGAGGTYSLSRERYPP